MTERDTTLNPNSSSHLSLSLEKITLKKTHPCSKIFKIKDFNQNSNSNNVSSFDSTNLE